MPPVNENQDDPKTNSKPTPPGEGDGSGEGNPNPGGDGGEGTGTKQTGSDGSKGSGVDGSSGNSLDDLPEWAQKEIKGLRSENAKSRTKSKGLEDRLGKLEKGLKSIFGDDEGDDDLTPEQKLEQAQTQNHGIAFENAMLELCLDKGITDKADRKYLAFLVSEAAEELEEGEELSEEKLDELVQMAKKKGSGKKASSSPDSDDPPNPDGDNAVTLDAFRDMNALEKNKLYREDPDTYNKLASEAKKKGMFV